MRAIRIEEETSRQRLDKYLGRYLKEAPASFLYKMLRKKNIVLNKKKATGKEILKEGDLVELYLAEETLAKFMQKAPDTYPVSKKLHFLFEDDNIALMNKPAGMLSQKAEKGDVSANEYFLGHLQQTGWLAGDDFLRYKPSVCNRLDRNTTGILIGAKKLAAARDIAARLKSHKIDKYYLTIVKGNVRKNSKIEAWLAKDERTNRVCVSDTPFTGAVRIETAYMPLAAGRESTLLLIRLISGKTHQIRSHLAHIAHPVAGDAKYGDAAYNARMHTAYGVRFQLLHSAALHFSDEPDTLSSLSGRCFLAPLPALMLRVIEGESLKPSADTLRRISKELPFTPQI